MKSFWRASFAILAFLSGTVAFSGETPVVSTKDTELRIAAASDLKFVLDELIKAFKKKRGEYLSSKVTYGSSGNLAAQLSQGAPFDLFFSANTDYAESLIKKGIADPASKTHYTKGFLVLWAQSFLDVDLEKSGMKALLNSKVQKIAIANPAYAPYGKAAEAAMKEASVYSQVKNKLVYGENVAQATQYVQSGAAQIGIIALSLVKAPVIQKKGKYWLVPQNLYAPIDQVAVIMSHAKNPKLSSLFLDYVKGSEGQEILSKYGFSSPEH